MVIKKEIGYTTSVYIFYPNVVCMYLIPYLEQHNIKKHLQRACHLVYKWFDYGRYGKRWW